MIRFRARSGDRRAISAAIAAVLTIAAASCARDAAEREYLAALRGEETGMTREEQIAHLDRAIELADRPYLRFLRGLALCQSGRHADALPDFDRAIDRQPENAQFYRGRALARVEVGLPVEALEDADRLVALAPQQAQSHYTRGMALAALGRDREAVAEYDVAVRQRPELVYPLLARAECWERVGDVERAAADRAAAEKEAAEHGRCAPCSDPFRY